MSQPQEQQTNGTGSETGPRYAEFKGKPMSDLELLALLQKGYSIRQGAINKQGLLMVWLQLPLERRVAVDPAQLQRFKRLGWVAPIQSTTGTIWELNRQPQPQPPTNSKITPIGAKRRLPRSKITEVVDDDDESGDDRHGHPTPTATANPNPCVRLFGPGPEGQTCKGCVYLLATRANRVYYKCRQRSITSSASTDHRQGWQACAKYQSAETAATTNTVNQPTGDRGQGQILNKASGNQPAPFNTNTNLGV